MRAEQRQRLRALAVPILILLLPFFVLFWLRPFCGTLTIGNDYPSYSIRNQLELNYSLVRGAFPLYVPGFAGGRSALALTLGQIYHPLSHLAAHSPGYWQGLALEWNTAWRLLSLGFTHLVLFRVLRRLRLRSDIAFVISFVTVYNLRMLDMFRYGASLESYTAFLLLCAALIDEYARPTRVFGPLSVMGSTYLLVCSGHPQMAYFGLLGAGAVCLFVPYVVVAPTSAPRGWTRSLAYCGRMAAYALLGLLLASLYTVPFYFEFLRDAPHRTERELSWALGHQDSLKGGLNSFFNPLRADVHGAFGSSTLLLLALIAPYVLAPQRAFRGGLLAVWLAFVLVFFASVGADFGVYEWFWRNVPLARSFRVPGRVSLLLPVMAMLILARLFWLLESPNAGRRLLPFNPAVLVLLVAALFVAWHSLPVSLTESKGEWVPARFAGFPGWMDQAVFLSGLACLLLLALRLSPLAGRPWVSLALIAAVLVQVTAELRYGTWVEPRKPTTTLAEMDRSKRGDLAFSGDPGMDLEAAIVLLPSAERTSFVSFRPERAADELRANQAEPTNAREYRVTSSYSAFNRLVFLADVAAPGSVVLAIPYSSQWQVMVDGKALSTQQTAHNELAVSIPAGRHQIEFRFFSLAGIIGMSLSCLTLFGLALYYSRHCPSFRWRAGVVLVATILPGAAFALWAHSLYNGADLGTRYTFHLHQ